MSANDEHEIIRERFNRLTYHSIVARTFDLWALTFVGSKL